MKKIMELCITCEEYNFIVETNETTNTLRDVIRAYYEALDNDFEAYGGKLVEYVEANADAVFLLDKTADDYEAVEEIFMIID